MDPISKLRNKPLIDEVPQKQTTEGTPAEAPKVSGAGIANIPDALVTEDPSRIAFSNLFSQEPHGTESPHLQENVTPAKTFPDGSAIVRDLSDILGDLKVRTDPSHLGIDLSKGGISARDLIAQVLGITNQSTAAPTGGIPAPPGMSEKANVFLHFFDIIKEFLEGPKLIEDVTGDATDGLRGLQAFGTDTSGNALLKKVDEGSKYVNPEGGPTPDIYLTPEQAKKIVELLKNINVKPENADGSTPPITAEDLKGASSPSPFAPHVNPGVIDRNPDLQESVSVLSVEQLAARLGAKGGDPVNPLDAPQSPPSELPQGPIPGPDDTKLG